MFRQVERFQAPLEKLKQEYARSKSAELRRRITKVSILFSEIDEAIRASDANAAKGRTKAAEALLKEGGE